MRLTLLLAALLAAPAMPAPAAGQDPYLWLEQWGGPRVDAWIKAENTRSLGVLTADPHYKPFFETALRFAQAADRVPTPTLLNGRVFNFWKDAQHIRGIWRATTPASYATATPAWTTVLDLDALARAEHANWIFKGATCAEPAEARCMIALSDGGEDAVVWREFDVTTGKFVAGGFSVPRAKTVLDWIDPDTLAIVSDWGPGTLTKSGYPFVMRTAHRGQPLSAAPELFRGRPDDVWVDVTTLTDAEGHRATIIQQRLDFFHSASFRVENGHATPLDLPEKAQPFGLLHGAIVFRTDQDWQAKSGTRVPSGGLATLAASGKVETLWAPHQGQALEEAGVTAHGILASIIDNVRGRVLRLTPGANAWTTTRLDLPDNAATGIAATSPHTDAAYLTVESFLQPNSIWATDGAAAPHAVKSEPARFNTSGMAVDQFSATAPDGTHVPYFVVHRANWAMNAANPTLLYAYGGFQVSKTPTYSADIGKLWLEQGGVFVLANIRGGGEFGPAWHEAALTTNRTKAWDDFAAVAKDLIARHITSPAKLGIRGGSNGGLLMGAQFTQHPELYGAVIIEVPLLDMERFEQIAAGASWVGEYGSMSNPTQRAFLQRTSPYAALRRGTRYPEPFVYTTTKDDRVGPQHARKFAARLAEYGVPYLYYEATEGGHSAGVNAREVAQEHALELTYLTRKLMK